MTGIDWMWVGVAALIGGTVAYVVFAVRYWNEDGPINEDSGRPFNWQDHAIDFVRLPLEPREEVPSDVLPASSRSVPPLGGRGARAQQVGRSSAASSPFSPDPVTPPSRKHDEGPDRRHP